MNGLSLISQQRLEAWNKDIDRTARMANKRKNNKHTAQTDGLRRRERSVRFNNQKPRILVHT